MKKGLWIGLFAALVLSWATPAEAAKKKKAKPAEISELARVNQDEDGYSYIFRDDPVDGRGYGAAAATIRVRPHGVRQMLLRPRVHFIPELLKSVEQI